MRASIICFMGGLIAAAGCSHGEGKATTEEVRELTPHAEADTQGGMATTATQDIDCPMQVIGTTVHAEETTSGPALAFATTGDVNELRARVQRMADAHNRAVLNSSSAPSHADNPAAADVMSNGATNMNEQMENANTTNSPSLQGGSVGTQGVTPTGKGAPPMGKAREEDIESGARLVFTLDDSAQVDQMRERVHSTAQMLASGKCPMTAAPMTQQSGQSGAIMGYPSN